ncbi:MAG: hypothetical protein ACPGNV_06105 [Mangrovicoccus sp.]
MSDAFGAALNALPSGSFRGVFDGRHYVITKTLFNSGRSTKLVAEALAGGDYISLNHYQLADGRGILKPCEMPADKVTKFVLGLRLMPQNDTP